MSVIGSNILAGASGQGGGYNLTKSLRFRSSASAYLNRTGSTATNAKLATYSFWFKRGILTTGQWLFTGGTTTTLIGFNGSSDALSVLGSDTSGEGNITTAVFRDPSAWYHVVIAIDTSQATTSDRAKIYVNGVQQAVSVSNGGITLNSNWGFNTAGSLTIGRYSPSPSSYVDGYLAEVNFIDGQALTPSSFGETSATTGVWIPKKYTGTYGTNGFYLPFTDTTSTSTLGTDFSGNSNTWTVNNISLTSGSTYDSMNDVPTLTSATASNYCVLNPIFNVNGTNVTYSNGNLTFSHPANSGNAQLMAIRGTIALPAGKYYWEYTVGATVNDQVGIGNNVALGGSADGTAGARYLNSGAFQSNYTNPSSAASYTTNDIIGVAYDQPNGTLAFYKNNSLQGTITNISTSEVFFPSRSPSSSGTGGAGSFNFGQQPFSYTPPAGFVALNTFNLPTPTIGATASTTANEYFDVSLWTGNGSSSQVVTNSGSMQPDFVWIKSRNQAFGHLLFDSVRGISLYLQSNSTGADTTDVNMLSSLNSNGFTVGSSGFTNGNTYTQVGWQWRASNATAVTNTQGSITSTVSASTTAGFSIVTYTGNGSNSTVGHGLGVAPRMVIYKRRNAADSWVVYNANIGAANNLVLNSTQAQSGNGSFYWNSTAPTSSVISTGTDSAVNASGSTYVAYCFAEVAGYSAFGSYTGNGSTDGAFIFTGFRPRYLMIKSTSVESWELFDTSRSPYNQAVALLEADSSGAENTSSTSAIDILSNGFKQRNTRGATNGSGTTYIYMAFAEVPQKFALGR